MKGMDRTVLVAIAAVGLIVAFWFLLLAPKRKEASALEVEVSALQVEVSEAEQAAIFSETAKTDFAANYRKLVLLGKAAPRDADTPSLLVQLQTLSDRSDVDFRGITLNSAAAGAPPAAAAPAPAPAPAAPAEGEETPAAAPATTTPAATPAGTTTPGEVPTETVAALLPIGATVGPAGLPVMPYSLAFQGGFFQIADFFGGLDSMVQTSKHGVTVDGRLLTVNGFSLTAGTRGFPDLTATVEATSYLIPADQGLTAGATPGGPVTPASPAAESATAPAVATATPVGG